MGVGGVKTTDFYGGQNLRTRENETAARKRIVFTDAAEMGKALANRKVNVDGVTIELSDEAMQALYDAREKYFQDRDAETERYVAEFNSYAAKQQSEACEDAAQDMAKALETARRISNGDIVPAKDEKKLMEYDFELYQIAKNAAMLHAMEERRKQKSLYRDEEEGEYTDPEAETAPVQKFGVELEVSLEGVPAVESVTEGALESLG